MLSFVYPSVSEGILLSLSTYRPDHISWVGPLLFCIHRHVHLIDDATAGSCALARRNLGGSYPRVFPYMTAYRLTYLGVVGNNLKVHGTSNLRIADASIMCVQYHLFRFFAFSLCVQNIEAKSVRRPLSVSCHIQATVFAIGERVRSTHSLD